MLAPAFSLLPASLRVSTAMPLALDRTSRDPRLAVRLRTLIGVAGPAPAPGPAFVAAAVTPAAEGLPRRSAALAASMGSLLSGLLCMADVKDP